MHLTIFEKSQKGQKAYSLPKNSSEFQAIQLPQVFLRKMAPALPEISEIDLTRHFSQLAHRNMGIDTHFYPLGSCTMKLNPRINELCAHMTDFTLTHPLAPAEAVQGNLQLIYELIEMLCEVCGTSGGSLVPNAGAQGELTGLQMIAAYHRQSGSFQRDEILIPDNAHGTNPATVTMAGFKAISIHSNAQGDLDLDHLKSRVSDRTAGLMLTNPNTLGLFSTVIKDIAEIIHKAGGFVYYDGANLNSILNVAKPGQMGFDVMHINLHKTFSTPHGGGGPGSGPVLCNAKLLPFLPVPKVVKINDHFKVLWEDRPSIGQMATFYGNFGIYLRAYVYAKLHGHFGLRKIAEAAVLNANYLKKRLEGLLNLPYPQLCMHEFVVQADNFLNKGIKALDIAKRMLDYNIYSPTIYFPLIVKECMLIEPTESESKATLDRFIEIVQLIIEEIDKDPEIVKQAPHTLSVSRLNEVRAAKNPILKRLCD